MADPVAIEEVPVAELLGAEFGSITNVVHVEQRPGFDLYTADAAGRPVLVKVGATARLAREAENLRRARQLIGDLAPELLGFVASTHARALLVMQRVPGAHLGPGGLTPAVWKRLVTGLLQLHGHDAGGRSSCIPLADDFVTLSVGEGRYASLPQLRALLSVEVLRAPGVDSEAALALFDEIHGEVIANQALFVRAPRLVHADLWPENMLVAGPRCWLVDWAWLKYSDYALDLACLKLMLDWVWPSWRAQLTFERVLRRYTAILVDPDLVARMRVYLPLVSLIHLVQFGQGGVEDPYNAAAMRACLTAARRDRGVWSQPTALRRVAFSLTHPAPSEYAAFDGAGPARPARYALGRLVAAGQRFARRSAEGADTLRR